MKTFTSLAVVLAALLLVAFCPVSHAGHRLGIGSRYHTDHSAFDELPFDDDISFGLTYQYSEDIAYWELGATIVPDPRVETLDYIVTPFANLMFSDGMWRGGLGVLSSYTEDKIAGDDWTDIYWQMVFGISIPIKSVTLDVQAYYVYEGWEDLVDFEFKDLEGGAWLTYRF